MHYNRYRYYDPNSGRFLSKDPIGLLGGSNVHAYAPNPTGWVDPLGLASKKNKKPGKDCCDDPCAGKNPAADARAWQGPGNEPYLGQDSYKNVVVKKGTVLYTLHPHGPNTPNYFVGASQVVSTRGQGAGAYNDALQIAHKGNWDDPKARDMRTKLHKFIVKTDTCMAIGQDKKNPQFGGGGGTQYFVSNKDKGNLLPTGMITDIK